MAEGIRILHPTARACILRIPHPGDPATGRRPKPYRIELDSNGEAIISTTIWQRLEEARAAGWPHGLIVANVVASPPKQRLELRRRITSSGAQRRQTLPIVDVGRT